MSRILALGYELPQMSNGTIEARSARTWQFIEPLLADGHQVSLLVSHLADQFDVPHSLGGGLIYHRLNMQTFGWRNRANRLLEAFKPDGLLGVMFNSCLRATRLGAHWPIWMDLYGDKIAESQVSEFVGNSTRGSRTMFRYLDRILRGGDVYSTCSTPQKYALAGQLGMVSRLDWRTFGYEFVHAILPGAPAEPETNSLSPAGLGELPDDAFIVLWCGGYNVWTDVDTLFQGLSQAMAKDPRIVYVSVGAGVDLENNDSYERLLEKIERSPFRDRFHMQGWRPVGDIPAYYNLAHVGINLDTFHYETVLGTRTRLVEMMHHGLPVISTIGCELSDLIRANGTGYTFPIGDVDQLASLILAMAADPQARRALADRASSFVAERLSFKETTRPFRDWAKDPYYAPDRMSKGQKFDARRVEYLLRSLVRGVLWDLWSLERGE